MLYGALSAATLWNVHRQLQVTTALQILSQVLGVKNSPIELEKAINNLTTEQMVELKKAEKDFQLKMKEYEIDIYSLETKDTQHAREKFSNDSVHEHRSKAQDKGTTSWPMPIRRGYPGTANFDILRYFCAHHSPSHQVQQH